MTRSSPFQAVMLTSVALGALCAGAGTAQAQFKQTNLVSNMPGLATITDSNLVNPWGVSFANGSPVWISDQGTQTSPLFPVTGSTDVSATSRSLSTSRPRESQVRPGGRQRVEGRGLTLEMAGMANPLRSSLPT